MKKRTLLIAVLLVMVSGGTKAMSFWNYKSNSEQDYQIRLTRPDSVGQKYAVTMSGERAFIIRVSSGGQIQEEKNISFRATFEGFFTVSQIDEHEQATELILQVAKCTKKTDERSAEDEVLPIGTIVVAKQKDEKTQFLIGQTPVSDEIAQVLGLFFTVSNVSITDDDVFGVSERHSIGDTWSVNKIKAAELFKSQFLAVASKDIDGRVKIDKEVNINGTKCLQISCNLKSGRLKAPSLPESFVVKKSGMSLSFTGQYPVDLTKGVMGATKTISVELLAKGKDNPRAPEETVYLKRAEAIRMKCRDLLNSQGPSPISGVWSSVGPFGDRTGLTTANIIFCHDKEFSGGAFVFTSSCDRIKRDMGTTIFPLVGLKIKRNHVFFAVPFSSDAQLKFELQRKDGKLDGVAWRTKQKGRISTPVTFQHEPPGSKLATDPFAKRVYEPTIKDYIGTWMPAESGFNFTSLSILSDHRGYIAGMGAAFFNWKLSDKGGLELSFLNTNKDLVLFARIIDYYKLLLTSNDHEERLFVKSSNEEPEDLMAKLKKKFEQKEAKEKEDFEKRHNVLKKQHATEQDLKKQFDKLVSRKNKKATLTISGGHDLSKIIIARLSPRSQKYEIEAIILSAGEVASGAILQYSREKPVDCLSETLLLTPDEQRILLDFFSSNNLKVNKDYFYQRNMYNGEIVYYQQNLSVVFPYDDTVLYKALLLFWEKILNKTDMTIKYISEKEAD